MTSNAHGYASKTISADFVPQIYPSPGSDHPIELENIAFDATEWILALDLGSVREVMDTGDVDEGIAPTRITDMHSGKPFYISNLDMAIPEFFGVERSGDISQEMLEQARAAHNIGQQKVYSVSIDRVEVRRITIEVEAENMGEATQAALERAYDTDFRSEGEVIDATYSCSNMQTKGLAPEPIRSADRPKP